LDRLSLLLEEEFIFDLSDLAEHADTLTKEYFSKHAFPPALASRLIKIILNHQEQTKELVHDETSSRQERDLGGPVDEPVKMSVQEREVLGELVDQPSSLLHTHVRFSRCHVMFLITSSRHRSLSSLRRNTKEV
jgi:hypothetical protein